MGKCWLGGSGSFGYQKVTRTGSVGGEELEQLGDGQASLSHHAASRFLHVVSLCELVHASSQHGGFREDRLFTWQLEL